MEKTNRIQFACPDYGAEERQAVIDVLDSGWLTTGDQCAAFETEFAQAIGVDHALAVNSCTAAMHLALEALTVGPRDMVVTTPYTFAATASVILHVGAIPIFVDITADTLNIDVNQLADVLSKLRSHQGNPAKHGSTRTAKAVMPVHIAGHPCPRDEIYQLAEEFQLAVVEDAAHAFPASSRGRPVGKTCNNAVRSAACFSFYATKTITTGEGGMLVTDDDDLIDRARIMSLHGLSKDAWARYSSSGSWRYDIIAPGFKYNMTDMAAALGRVQLRRAYEMRSRRSEIAEKYNAAFSSVDALTIPSVLSDTETAWHLYQLRIPKGRRAAHNREDFISSLNNSGIGTSVHFIPLHLQPYYQNTFGYAPSDFPVSTAEFEREISLPIYSSMTDHEVERVIEAVLIAASRF